jgi:non-homologous end joining protein Ku
MKVIENKVKSGGKAPKATRTTAEKPSKVIDLVSVLQASLGEAHKSSKGGSKKAKRSKSARHHHQRHGRRKAA